MALENPTIIYVFQTQYHMKHFSVWRNPKLDKVMLSQQPVRVTDMKENNNQSNCISFQLFIEIWTGCEDFNLLL